MSIRKTFSVLFVILLQCFAGQAQVSPRFDANINYTSLYLEEELHPGGGEYELVLYTDSTFESKVPLLVTKKSALPTFFVQDLEWNQHYKWYVNTYDKSKAIIHKSNLNRFATTSTLTSFVNGVEVAKFDIITNKEAKHAGGLIFLDHGRSLFDRNGKAVWTLPPYIKGFLEPSSHIRDLKMTNDNTITFLVTDGDALEIDLDANVLWKAPFPFVFGKDTIAYHHDLKKTKRGTYIVLGNKRINRHLIGNYTKKQIENEPSGYIFEDKAYRSTLMNVVLEFDKDGNLIWFWDASQYVTDEDLSFKRHSPEGAHLFASHANGFTESEDGTKIYVSFRDLSRVVVVDKKTKKVIMSYGEKFPSGEGKYANDLFRKQHDATITKRKSILLFDNNEAPTGKVRNVSSIVEFHENPVGHPDPLIWRFPLNYDTLTSGWSAGGGNVTELPNGNILVCGGTLNRMVEVTRSKEVVWDVILTGRAKIRSNWVVFPQYRASWIPGLKYYYFTPYTTASKGVRGEINLTIANTGNAEDRYKIEVMAKDKSLYKKTSVMISANTSSSQNIKLTPVPAGVNEVTVIITSEKGRKVKQLTVGL